MDEYLSSIICSKHFPCNSIYMRSTRAKLGMWIHTFAPIGKWSNDVDCSNSVTDDKSLLGDFQGQMSRVMLESWLFNISTHYV